MSRRTQSVALLFAMLLVIPVLPVPIAGADGREIPLEEVPEQVLEAARQAVPGIELLEAEVEVEDGVTVYELEGVLEGVEYEIEVTEDGEVLEVEKEGHDDDDDEHGHDDDEHDEHDDHDDDDDHEGHEHDGDEHR